MNKMIKKSHSSKIQWWWTASNRMRKPILR